MGRKVWPLLLKCGAAHLSQNVLSDLCVSQLVKFSTCSAWVGEKHTLHLWELREGGREGRVRSGGGRGRERKYGR